MSIAQNSDNASMDAEIEKLREVAEARGPNPFYTPTIIAAWRAFKEEEYGGKMPDEAFRLGHGDRADEPYYTDQALRFRAFKAGAEWMERFCAEHAAERYPCAPDPRLSLEQSSRQKAEEERDDARSAINTERALAKHAEMREAADALIAELEADGHTDAAHADDDGGQSECPICATRRALRSALASEAVSPAPPAKDARP